MSTVACRHAYLNAAVVSPAGDLEVFSPARTPPIAHRTTAPRCSVSADPPVEEQFYLVWPLAIGGLFLVTSRAGRWRWWLLRGAVAILGLASVLEALHFASTNLSRAYYGTDT
ncbi:MAG TPA: hypothetical protein VIJ48_00530, partial [Acidimicrobiia bacterium]